MFLVAGEENSRYSRFNPPLLFNRYYRLFLKDMGWKHTAYHMKYNILEYEEVFNSNITIERLKQIVKFIEELNLKQ